MNEKINPDNSTQRQAHCFSFNYKGRDQGDRVPFSDANIVFG